jgi:peptidoglycan hydrolase CwlO-like protein
MPDLTTNQLIALFLILLCLAILFWWLGRSAGRAQRQLTINELRKTLADEVKRADRANSELCTALRQVPSGDAVAVQQSAVVEAEFVQLQSALEASEARISTLQSQLRAQESEAANRQQSSEQEIERLKSDFAEKAAVAALVAEPVSPPANVEANLLKDELSKTRQQLESQLGEKDRGLAQLSDEKDRLAREIHDLRQRVGELVAGQAKAQIAGRSGNLASKVRRTGGR